MKKVKEDTYLQCSYCSAMRPFKICIVCKNKKKLLSILNRFDTCKIGKEKRCGYVGFVYFIDVELAKKLRKELYFEKDLYVFLQDDTHLIEDKDKYKKNSLPNKIIKA